MENEEEGGKSDEKEEPQEPAEKEVVDKLLAHKNMIKSRK